MKQPERNNIGQCVKTEQIQPKTLQVIGQLMMREKLEFFFKYRLGFINANRIRYRALLDLSLQAVAEAEYNTSPPIRKYV